MRKLLCATVALTFATTAVAQQPIFSPLDHLPRTVIIQDPDGKTVGSATISGNITVYRDANGELTGSSKITPDGTKTFYDVNGKVTATNTTSGNVITNRDAAGQITGTISIEKDGTKILRDASGQIVGSSRKP
jgi:YD repeat-containing protein